MNHVFISVFVFLVLACLSLGSCEYHNEQELYPNSYCDSTRTSTYSGGVQAVLSQHCYSCHSGNAPSAGFVIDSYESLSPFVDNGNLLCSVQHGDDCLPMPDDAPMISDCDINLIQQWITNGAQDD